MKQTLLGLDIGANTIKGVRLAKSFRGLRLLDHFEITVPAGLEDEISDAPLTKAQIKALSTLLAEGKIMKGDLVTLAVPGDLVSTREITLPFTDLKKIDQILPFETEGELPFDIETASIDYMVLQRPKKDTAQHNTTLLVSAMPNTTLKAYLDLLRPIGIDPAWIGTNALSLFTFSTYFLDLDANGNTDILLIDMGAKRTTLCHTQRGQVHWVRTLSLGGDLITERLAERLGLSWDEAEKKKSEIYLGIDHPTDEKNIIALEAVESAVTQIVTEIEKSRQMLSPSHEERPSEIEPPYGKTERPSFYLCGGSSRLKGLKNHLSAILKMDAVHIKTQKGSRIGNIQGIEKFDPESISEVYPVAFGLALQDSEGPPINFRQGEFVFGKESIARRQRFVSLGLILLLLLGLMGGDLYLHYQKKEAQYQSIKTTLRQTFVQIFPNIRNVVNEVEQTRTAIKERRETGQFFGINESSPLTALKEISEAIPDNIKIDVFNLVIDSGTVRIQAQTDSFESVDRIRSGLLTGKQFQQVEVSDAKAAANQKNVRFRIKMTLLGKEHLGKKRTS